VCKNGSGFERIKPLVVGEAAIGHLPGRRPPTVRPFHYDQSPAGIGTRAREKRHGSLPRNLTFGVAAWVPEKATFRKSSPHFLLVQLGESLGKARILLVSGQGDTSKVLSMPIRPGIMHHAKAPYKLSSQRRPLISVCSYSKKRGAMPENMSAGTFPALGISA
jgi:hypothetical protein